MIKSFADRKTQELFDTGDCPPVWKVFQSVAERKLDMLNAATSVSDLRSPPGNRLEKLRGNRAGQWSIRINGQYRICFRWDRDGPVDVEILDYHD
jgi:toxin HigB-1